MTDDHSASRRVDVLAEEAPHLIAPDPLVVGLRDEIVRLLAAEIVRQNAPEPTSATPIDEDGVTKLMVVDADANCFRVTVERI